MKKGLFLILSMTLSYLSMAQVPNSFSYQMVIRNGNNELVANTTVGIRIGLLGGNAADTIWYEEEHKVKTNLNGLAYITIGKGNMLKGTISTIDWTRGPFFIKSETDPNAPDELGFLNFKRLDELGNFANFLRANLPKEDPSLIMSNSEAQGTVYMDILGEISYWNKYGLPRGMPSPDENKSKYSTPKKAA